MFAKKSNGGIAFTLLITVIFWGASNAGTKYLTAFWPAGWLGATRLLGAGLILLAILKWTRWLGAPTPLTPQIKRALWLRGGLTLACYLVVFNLALQFTAVAHVALYLGMSPLWTLLWDDPPRMNWRSAWRYAAASLAVAGILILFWPALNSRNPSWRGELLGLLASFLWAAYGLQCRALGARLSGAEISAHTMWRGGILLAPLAMVEIWRNGLVWRFDLVLVQTYCSLGGGVIAYALWNNALRHWPASQVFLFNNLIPLSTMGWARICLGAAITRTFWLAMLLVMAGVILGQAGRRKVLEPRWLPRE